MQSAYTQALDAIKNFTVEALEQPLCVQQSTVTGTIADLPLKSHDGKFRAKIFFDIVENIRRSGIDMARVQACMSENRYDDLPSPFGPKKPLPDSYKLQIAIVHTSATHCTIIKQYICNVIINIRCLEDYMYGKLFLVDLSPNYRSGPIALQYMIGRMSNWFAGYWKLVPKAKESKEKEKKPVDSLQAGFDYIRTEGPRSNLANRQVEWAEIEVNRPDGPLMGWSAGLVKECLRSHTCCNVYSKPITNYFLTLHDISGWVLGEVLVHILGDLQSKTLVMMGLAEKGKTPLAQAIAMAVSEYHILVQSPTIFQDMCLAGPAAGGVRYARASGHTR